MNICATLGKFTDFEHLNQKFNSIYQLTYHVIFFLLIDLRKVRAVAREDRSVVLVSVHLSALLAVHTLMHAQSI